MPGKSSSLRTELASQNAALMTAFTKAGHEYIAPEIIQPADVFLERAGEDIRSRTYVFTDPDGNELCLRPDITVPACRYHLASVESAQSPARYCYNGPVFRHHGADTSAPREFDQLGLEWFGATDKSQAEAEIFNLTIAAMEAAGLKNYTVRVGDLGLFHGLLEAIEMPKRWRRRLAREFWRPRAFYSLLRRLTGEKPQAKSSLSDLVEQLAASKEIDAKQMVETILDDNDWPLVPGRSSNDITARLSEKAADQNSHPLDKESATLINTYLNIHGDLPAVEKDLRKLAKRQSGEFSSRVETLINRTGLFDLGAMKNGSISFAAEFGRSLEYYTGFVFQIEVRDQGGGPLVIAGGGRYDNLISDIGNCPSVPAVGSAIYPERLLAAVNRQSQ